MKNNWNNYDEEKKRRQKIFKKALEEAFNIVKEAVCLPKENIKKLWEENLEDRKINWFHDIKNECDDIVNLSKDTETPITFCKKKNKLRPIYFRCSRFFQSKDFLDTCSEYYKQFGLKIDILPDNITKGKWWVNLEEIKLNSCTL
tara:strand:+ start:201 stop:635 length:435 start_codon:yes stop_codon:yes gene_type:complete